eukprot:s1044_g21.t1
MQHTDPAATSLDAGEPLILAGLEVLLTFCTLWTWCLKIFYFFFATCVSALYVCFAWVPPFFVTAGLWVVFDMAFGMAWLVFWAVWVFLLPFAFVSGNKAAVDEMLSFLPFYLHNANVVLMMVELICSRWTMNLEHSIFPVYFALSYLYFNWWLYSKIHVWIYFFLDYNRPSSVPVCLTLCGATVASFSQGPQGSLPSHGRHQLLHHPWSFANCASELSRCKVGCVGCQGVVKVIH